MTKRRLINKIAYDEMLLLKKLAVDNNEHSYQVSLQVNKNGEEQFVVDHYFEEEWIAKIVGENYTVISKMLIGYLSNLNL